MKKSVLSFSRDEFGPEYVIRVSDSHIDLEGYLVIDNTVLGPGKGGFRMTPTLTMHEVWRLARTMTWKNALADLPFGGAKGGIVYKKSTNLKQKRRLVERYAELLSPLMPSRYIGAPDVNVGEEEIRWFVGAAGSLQAATGKPADLCDDNGHCGLPHELGSTGYGVAEATLAALEIWGLPTKKATVAIEGFGNVGRFTFKFLQEYGLKIIAVSDSKGGIYDESGLDYAAVLKTKTDTGSVIAHPTGQKINPADVFTLPVDVLVPASVSDVIHLKNVDNIKAKIIVEAANIPMSEDCERLLFRRGIQIVPDIVANAGGVISSYGEYMGFDRDKTFTLIKNKVAASTRTVLSEVKRGKSPARSVAVSIAQERIQLARRRRNNTGLPRT